MKTKTNNLTYKNTTNKATMPYRKRASLNLYKKINKKYRKRKTTNKLMS